jgi:hypothetical protein
MFLLLIAFAVFFIVESPTEAAKLVRQTGETAGEWVATAADSFSQFLKTLI